MTKFRKILITLLSLVMIASFSAFAVGCGDNTDEGDDITVSIQDKVSEIELGDEGSFNAKVVGLDDATIIWTTNDSAILTVSPTGAFEAKTIGNVVITATYAGDSNIKDTMAVTVKKSNVGVLSVEDTNYSIMLGNTSQLNPYVQYNSKRYSDGVLFTYSSSDETVVTVNSNGKITAIGEGHAVIEIKTSFRNDSISTSVDVSVKASSFISIFAPQNRNSTIYTLNYDNHTTGFAYTYEVYEDGEAVNNPVITWSSSDEDVATVDQNGNVVAVSAGVTTITASFTDTFGGVHTDIDKVYVAKPVFDTQKLISQYLVGEQLVLPVVSKYSDFNISNVVNITCGGVDAYNSNGTLNKDVVIGSPELYRELVVETEFAFYSLKVRVTNAIVSSVADLIGLQDKLAVCKADECDLPQGTNNYYLNGVYFDGYVEFADDIDMSGVSDFNGIATYVNRAKYSEQMGKKNGFRGTIDGKGFTISNLTLNEQKNFIKYIGTGAVVKDLKFDNLTVSGKNTAVFGKVYAGATFSGIDIKGEIVIEGSYDKSSAQGLVFSTILGSDVKFENATIWLTNDSVAFIDSTNFVSVIGAYSSSNAKDYASIFGNIKIISSTNKLLTANVAAATVLRDSDITSIVFYSGEVSYFLAHGWVKDSSSTEANCYQAGHYTLTKAGETNKEYDIKPLGHDLVFTNSQWVCSHCQQVAKEVDVMTDVKTGLTSAMIDSTKSSLTIAYSMNSNNLPNSVESGKINFTLADPMTFAGDEDVSRLIVALSDGSAYIVNVDLYSLIVKNKTDFLNMYSYVNQIDAQHCDGRIIFDENLTLDMTGNKWKKENNIHTSTSTLYGGFMGTIDGNGSTVSNLSFDTTSYFGLIDIAYGCTIKNLTLKVENAKYGIIARRIAGGITLDNVTVELCSDNDVTVEWDKTNGVLLGFLCMSSSVNLKDVTFIYSGLASTKLTNVSLIAGTQPAYSSHSYDFKGTVNVDNLVVVGVENADALPFNGPKHSKDPEYEGTVATPFGIDNGVSIVGTKGITIYKTVEDYNANTNAYSMTNTVLTPVTGVNAKQKLDLASLTATVGDKLARVRVYSNYAYDKSDITKKGAVILPSEAGEYTYYFLTDDYKTYSVTVTAGPAIVLEQVIISDSFVYDLKDGFNVNTILSNAGQDPDTIESVTIGDQVFEADDDGNVSFGEAGTISNIVLNLPKDEVQTVILTGSKQYNLNNFMLYSIIVSNCDELKAMNQYQAINADNMYYAVIGFDADVELTGGWTTANTLASGRAVTGGGFNGVIDGCGHTISKFVSEQASLMASANKCVVRNLNFQFDVNGFNGAIAKYASGCEISNVKITSSWYTSGNKGLLFGELYGNGGNSDDIKLTNITFINNFNPTSSTNGKTLDNNQALIGAIYTNSASYLFKAGIVINNIKVVSTGANLPALRLVKGTYRTAESYTERVLDLGSGIRVAQGGTSVTYYTSIADYEAGTNGVVATTRDVIEVNATLNENFDFSTQLDAGDTFDYLITSIAGSGVASSKYQKGSPKTFKFTTAGTYFVSVRTTNFHFYTFKVTVA